MRDSDKDFEQRKQEVAKLREDWDVTESEMETMQIRELMNIKKPDIMQLVSKRKDIDRYIKSFLVYLGEYPELMTCTRKSLFSCFLSAVELELDFNKTKGWCYIVKFYDNKLGADVATFMPGYRGFIELVTRHERIRKIEAKIAYKGDDFSVQEGSDPKIIHSMCLDGTRGDEVVAAYAIATFGTGEQQQEIVMFKDLEKVRKSAKTQKVWSMWPDEMRRKTAIKRLIKYLPWTNDAVTYALEQDNKVLGMGDNPEPNSPEATMNDLIEAEKNKDAYDDSDKMDQSIIDENKKMKEGATDAEVVEVPPEPVDEDKKAKGQAIIEELRKTQAFKKAKDVKSPKKKAPGASDKKTAVPKEEPLPEVQSDDVPTMPDGEFKLNPWAKDVKNNQEELNI